MRIVFTGGGTGGHFYPIISVVEEIQNLVKEKKLLAPELYFIAPHPYNSGVLYDKNIEFKRVLAGKRRVYKSPLNILDIFITGLGAIQAIWKLFWIYPDVLFSKGGYGSVPVVFAAKLLKIPIVIHESDSAPGRANQWAGKFADKIALSYPEAAEYFDEEKVAWTGNPVRKEIKQPVAEGAHKYLGLSEELPVIFVMGGSSGAKAINDAVLETLPTLVEKYQIIHQTGKKNYQEVTQVANIQLGMSEDKNRYKAFDYLNNLAMRMSAGAADLIITRAGSTLFEISYWGIPSIVIPLHKSNSNLDHQRKNAFNYARAGACTVIEEENLRPEILVAEIERILGNQELYQSMVEGTKKFAKPDAAKIIADEILELALAHEE